METKILIIGDDNVGKESLCNVFKQEKPLQDLKDFPPDGDKFKNYVKNFPLDLYDVILTVDLIPGEISRNIKLHFIVQFVDHLF